MIHRFYKRVMEERSGSALVFTLMVFAVLMILAAAAISVTSTDSQVASAHEGSKAALYVAESAVDIAKQQIIDADGLTAVLEANGEEVPGGEYDYTITPDPHNPNVYRIEVTGRAELPNGATATKKIKVIFKHNSPPPPGRIPVEGVEMDPPTMKLKKGESKILKAVIIPWNADNKNVTWETANPDVATVIPDESDNNKAVVEGVELGVTDIIVTTVEGGFIATCEVEVTTDAPPDTDPPANNGNNAFDYAVLGQGKGTGMLQIKGDIKIQGPVHSNSKIHLKENKEDVGVTVTGPVSATEDIKIIGQNGDFSGVEMNVGVPPVVMPEINWDYIRENATQVYDKKTSLDRNEIHEDDVIFVDGDLTLTGEVSGNALIVATGDITISGDYDYPSSDYAVVGLFAGKNLKLFGDDGRLDLPGVDGPEIRGLVIALNNVITQGEAKVTGSVICGNNMECGSGELNIEYVDGNDNPVYDVLDIIGTEIIANYDEL